ncbi:hypothetical protein MXB_4793 [Myxobolus squamalis]|nr:hypothetical protein MXB_4793 [Myxobolus squamalis]
MEDSSRIFEPYRVIGTFCNEYGFAVENFGSDSFVTTSIGSAFQTYNCKKLNLICVSDQFNSPIKKICATGTGYIVCSHGHHVSVWKRGKMVGEPIKHTCDVINLMCIGNYVFSLDEQGCLLMWNAASKKINFENFFTGNFAITAWCHPPTYLNKILLGFVSGSLQIWDIITW